MVTLAMENTDELREAVLDRLKKNGTLNRIQAELRSAIFLAIEQKEEDIKEDEPCDDEKSIEYALILHYLRQNRLSATAAVFEKEINRVRLQKLTSFEFIVF
ncbi:hypothetical protein AB6A40_008585 [Gnathostoma spinigerum]|uniref:LisH domain-containing protein n=1 Tax=Gnathostoma spinigerum TaxID=75299 RepID=A0ABD6EPW8_9BILA